jgi:hypothetical protein
MSVCFASGTHESCVQRCTIFCKELRTKLTKELNFEVNEQTCSFITHYFKERITFLLVTVFADLVYYYLRSNERISTLLHPACLLLLPPADRPACLPFISTVSGKISRIIGKHHIDTIHKPPRKPKNQLTRVKDSLGLKTPGVYQFPCESGEVHIGENGRTVETRIKEHKARIRLAHP